MVRKGSFNFKNDNYHRSETSARVCKTPRIILEKLKIPLDSVVLVRGDSIIYPLDSSEKKDLDVIDISSSDDEDLVFQNEMIKRFQSTKASSTYMESDPVNFPGRGEHFSSDTLPVPEESAVFEASCSTKTVKPGPKSKKKIFAQTKVIKRKPMAQPNNSGKVRKYEAHHKQHLMKKTGKRLLDSENTEMDIEVQSNVDSEEEDLISPSPPPDGQGNSVGAVCNSASIFSDNVNKKSTKIRTSVNKHDTNKNFLQESSKQRNESRRSLNLSATNEMEDNLLSQDDYRESSTEIPSGDHQRTYTNNKSDVTVTPCRISQRIKNKKVKFSALRLLAGGDIYTLRKEFSDNLKKSSSTRKSMNKTQASNTADINANSSSFPVTCAKEPTLNLISSTKESTTCLTTSPISRKDSNEAKEGKNQLIINSNAKIKNSSFSKRKQNLNEVKIKNYDASIGQGPVEKSLLNDRNNVDITSTEKDHLNGSGSSPNNKIVELAGKKLNESSEEVLKFEKNTTKKVNDKIRLELKGAPEKKVVNITVSPLKEPLKLQEARKDNVKQRLGVGLGPDIVIRRVKKVSDQGVTESGTTNDALASSVQDPPTTGAVNTNDIIPSNIVVKNLLYADKKVSGSKPIEEVEVPPQIKKILLEVVKSKKTNQTMEKENSSVSNEAKEIKISSIKKKKKFRDFNKRRINSKASVGKAKLMAKSKGFQNEVASKKDGESDEAGISDREMLQDVEGNEQELSDVQNMKSSVEGDDSLKCTDELNEVLDKNARKSPRAQMKGNNFQNKDTKIGESKKNSKDNESFSSNNVLKVGGKKTAKVTPLRQVHKVQPRSEIFKKAVNDKVKANEKEFPRFPKSKTVPKLSSPTELGLLGGKRNYRNAFEKYFICTEKIYEHNDSVDSDSGSEDTLLLSHFIDLKRKGRENKEEIDAAQPEEGRQIDADVTNRIESRIGQDIVTNLSNINPVSRITDQVSDNFIDAQGKGTINEVIKGITEDLPKWNWHVLPESSVICLILLEREDKSGTLDVKKCIEIDCNFKANVYVNKVLVNEYCGVYDSFDAIKNLIYQVDLL